MERGLTLPEVLVAALIISLGAVGVMVVVPIATSGLHEGHHLSLATFLADQRLEQVRSARWSAAPDGDCLGVSSGGAPAVPAGVNCAIDGAIAPSGTVTFPDETPVPGHEGFTRTVRIVDCSVAGCSGTSSADLRLVVVQVTYPPMTGAGTVSGTKATALTFLAAKR